MRMFALTLAALLLASTPVPSALAGEIPGSGFSYGNWSGAGYFNDDTGRFSHCAASAEYVSEDVLAFSITSSATVGILVSNESWDLRDGQQFDVVVQIDRRAPFYGTAKAIDRHTAALFLSDFERALRAVQKGYGMTISPDAWTGRYDLAGTFGALERAKRCALAYYRRSDFAGPSPAPEQPAASSVDPAYLYQLATVMIAEAGIRDFRYLTEREKASYGLLSQAVYWTSEARGIIGGVRIERVGSGTDLSALDAEDIHSLARECSGDVVTGARALEQASLPAREIRAVCSAADSAYEVFLTRTLIGDNMVELLLYFTGSASGSTPERRGLSEDVRLRTASFVATTSE